MSYEILDKDFFNLPVEEAKRELAALDDTAKARLYVITEKFLSTKLKDLLREDFFLTPQKKIINCDVNGEGYELQICPGTVTKKEVKTQTYDYEAALKFAQERGLEIPMTERIVIEPKVDFNAFLDQGWFQENCDQWKTETVDTKETKSAPRILIKKV
ncbi:MAG: hypothetical protein HUJ52_03205 [Malacoplasma sp.]|nr:hypothetical protein [Malacoplasma sp.]